MARIISKSVKRGEKLSFADGVGTQSEQGKAREMPTYPVVEFEAKDCVALADRITTLLADKGDVIESKAPVMAKHLATVNATYIADLINEELVKVASAACTLEHKMIRTSASSPAAVKRTVSSIDLD